MADILGGLRMQMINPSCIKVKNLIYSIGNKTILNDITFDIPNRGVTFLLGRNGAGKTTLFSLLTRFYKAPKNSEIMLFSLDINKHSHTIFKKIGIVFQQRTLDLDLSVRQNLMYFAQLHGLKKEQSISSIAKNLQTFGLLDALNQKVRTLSGGQIRRIELVRSLLNQPELLLLDEPTVGLDIESRIKLTNHVRHLAQKKLAALWSTHLIDEVNLNDYIIILEQGQIIAADYASNIIKSANTENLQQAFVKLTGSQINEQ